MSATEVPIRTLKNGQCFALHLDSGSVITGRLLERNAGSARTTMGHWSLEALVEPITEMEYQNKTEDTKMAKKERKAKAEPKERKVARYTVTDKDCGSLKDADNKSFAALVYKAIKAKAGIDFAGIWSEISRSVSARTEGDTPKATIRGILSTLGSKKLIKAEGKRVVVLSKPRVAKAKAEKPAKAKVAAKKAPKATPKVSAKPRKAPKAKPAKAPVVQTQPELSEPVQAAVEHIEQGMEKLGQEEQATA